MGGVGRILILKQPMALGDLSSKIRTELELESGAFSVDRGARKVRLTPPSPSSDELVQVAYAKPERERTLISTVAICAGSGGSMLLGVEADVYFTGEMSHHEVLAAMQSGHNVILCEHSFPPFRYLPPAPCPAALTADRSQAATRIRNVDTCRGSQKTF